MSYTVVRLGLGVCGWLHTLVPWRGLSEPSFSDGSSSSDADRSLCGFRARDFMVPQATTHTVHPPAPDSTTHTPLGYSWKGKRVVTIPLSRHLQVLMLGAPHHE